MRQRASVMYADSGRRALAPIAGHVIPVIKGAADTVCARLLGHRAGAAWMGMLKRIPWIAPGALSLTVVSAVISCLSVFDVPAFRGWTAACLIAACAAPSWLLASSLFSVPVLKRLFTMFDTYFLLFTATCGLTALAYALDNQFDERTLALMGGWFPNLVLAILSDAGRPTQRRLTPAYTLTGAAGCVVFLARLCTLRASRYDPPIILWTLSYAISNIAFSYLLTVALFLLRATLVLLLLPRGTRFILSAPMRLMPVNDTTPDTGESAYEGLQGGEAGAPGSLVLAPPPDAAISFDSRRTVARALLGERRAAALWRLVKAVGWLCLVAQFVGVLLGVCMLFDVAVTRPAGVAALLLLLPGPIVCFSFVNVDLLIHLTSRFEVLFLVSQTLSCTFGAAATFTWSDPRSLVSLGFGLFGALPICFLDSWYVQRGLELSDAKFC
jgi:hypothetical protein